MSELDAETQNVLAKMLDEPYEKYWTALGRFIHTFSGMESVLHTLLCKAAGVSNQTGRAVFHGVRVDNAKSTLNRIYEARGDMAALKRLERPFSQLGIIGGVRNNIVHWGARDTSAGLLVSNAHFRISERHKVEYVVSADALADMTADLGKVMMLLYAEMARLDQIQGNLVENYERIGSKPWRYKPPPQSQPEKGNATRAQRRERARQQGASQA